MIDGFIALYIFMLAAFTGYEIIGRVPSILHTPLMSGSNFVHGIVLVGAMVALGLAETGLEKTIGFIGVVVMAGPAGNVNALGIAVALFAALMHATLQIILRHLGKFERPETVTFYFLVIGTIVTALPLPFVAVTPTMAEVPLLFGVGLSGAAAQFLLSTAFRNAPAAVVTVFNYSSIVWATLFGWMIWSEWPMPTVLAGAAIVIASNALVIWRESRARPITGARVRAKF